MVSNHKMDSQITYMKKPDTMIKNEHYKYHYSEDFEQFRIHLAEDRNFYYWFTPLCRIDTINAVDKTIGTPVIKKLEDGVGGTIFEIDFKSTVWQEKKAYVIFSKDRVEYFVKVRGKAVIDRVYYFTGIVDEQLFGSVPGFDTFIPGCTNFLTKKELFTNEFFSISANNDTTHWGHSLCSGPFMYMFSRYETGTKIWAGLVVEKGCNSFDSFDFNHKPPEMERENESILNTQSFSVNYSGHLNVDGEWRSPSLFIGFSRDKLSAITDYCSLLEKKKAISKADSGKTKYPWHRKPIFCGWHEQTALGRQKMNAGNLSKEQLEHGSFIMDECTQANHEKWVDVLLKNKIPFGTLIIDAKWQKELARFDADERKWPDMRGFIDACHERGIKVLLWMQAWAMEGLDETFCITKDGKAVAQDPTSPACRKILEDGVEHMLSSAPGGLNADGIKIDGTDGIPCGRGVKNYGGIYGFELQRLYIEIIYKKAIAVKKDALISLYIANPYFRDVCNIIRLGDLYTVYGRPVDTLRERAEVVKIAMKGKPVDTDGNFRFSIDDDYLMELDEQLAIGIPCIYQAENLYQHRSFVKPVFRKFTQHDYAAVRNIFMKYLKSEGLYNKDYNL